MMVSLTTKGVKGFFKREKRSKSVILGMDKGVWGSEVGFLKFKVEVQLFISRVILLKIKIKVGF